MEIRNLRIEDCNTFEEVAENKRFAYEVTAGSQINVEGILSGLYKDPTHFIFELIQNAEDACAKQVSIELETNRMIFRHNGEPFTLRDLKGITSVNYSEKSDDYTKIGRFGIGFKAVFGICETPEIYSGEFNFKICNFYVPVRIDTAFPNQKNDETVIVLNFKKDIADTIYTEIEKTLVNLPSDSILFLHHIEQIDYLTLSHCGYYVRKKNKSESNTDYYDCQIVSAGATKARYYIFEKGLSFNGKLKVSIAYRADIETGKIVSDGESTKLVVYFPTEKDTFLQFKINGPFQTTPTRENVPETAENKSILNELVGLYKESIFCLKENGVVNADFYEMLPLQKRNYGFYSTGNAFYDYFQVATQQLFEQYELLPTHDGEFTNASSALLSQGMMDLLDENDNALLFGARTKWLSSDITRNRTQKLFAFLTDTLKVREVDFEALMPALSQDFLQSKNDEWFVAFYTKCNNNVQTIKSRYLLKEFIKTESGKIVAPFVQSKIRQGEKDKNVYLPSSLIKDKDKMVSAVFLQNDEIKSFFANIGIEEIDVVESIRTEWLPILHASKDETDNADNIKLLYWEYIDHPQQQAELRNLLKNSEFIIYQKDSGDYGFAKPTDVFLRNSPAEKLYFGNKDAVFASEQLSLEAEKERGFGDFLKSLGVEHSIRLITKSNQLTYDERKALLQNAGYSTYHDEGCDIWGLDYIIANIDYERSHLLYQQLNSLPESKFKGEFTWKYFGYTHTKSINAYFVKKLQQAKWLFNEDGEQVTPDEIFEDEVRRLYGGGEVLRHFDFKPDIIKQLPADDQRRLEAVKNLPLEFILQMAEQYNQTNVTTQVISANPEENPVDIHESDFVNPKKNMSADELVKTDEAENSSVSIIDQVLDSLFERPDVTDELVEKAVVKKVSNAAELDGDLGERYVLSSLKKHYSDKGFTIYNDSDKGFTAKKGEKVLDIVRHNLGATPQKGYDISVSRLGEVIAYIEVKSKKSDEKEVFTVSGLQWEFAKKLYEEGNADKHFVYVVTNVRDKDRVNITRYQNVYKAWLEGKIDARVVKISY